MNSNRRLNQQFVEYERQEEAKRRHQALIGLGPEAGKSVSLAKKSLAGGALPESATRSIYKKGTKADLLPQPEQARLYNVSKIDGQTNVMEVPLTGESLSGNSA